MGIRPSFPTVPSRENTPPGKGNRYPLTTASEEKTRNQAEWERRILHGLSCEWTNALWVLSFAQRQKMLPPLFALGDFQDLWGVWSRIKKEIILSRRLVLNHSWDSVREVLLHETAHQFADEVLGAYGETPHGPQFQEACRLLRASPRASGTYPPLDQRIEADAAHSEDKTLLRIRKLMALAESPNLHEAEAAMAKAQHLITKYNFQLLETKENRLFVTVSLGRAALRHPAEEYGLAHLLQEFYFVQGIWVSSYLLEKERMGRVLEVSGTLSNIQVASYVYDFVSRFIRSQWQEYNSGKNLNRRRQTDFALGIIEGFRSKLRSGNGAKDSSSALIRLKDPQLDQFFSYKYPRTVKIKGGRTRQDPRVLHDGKEVGRRLVISKGLESAVKSRKLQIAGG